MNQKPVKAQMKKTNWKYNSCGNCGYNYWDDAPDEYSDEGIPICKNCGCAMINFREN